MWCKPTEKQLAALPPLYSTEDVRLEDKKIMMHFFIGGCDWYMVEYDPKERLFWGFAILNGDMECAEWGLIPLDDLMTAHAGLCEVERDRHWRVRKASEVGNIVKAHRWQVKEGVAS